MNKEPASHPVSKCSSIARYNGHATAVWQLLRVQLKRSSWSRYPSIIERTMLIKDFTVASPNVQYTDEHIHSKYEYATTKLQQGNDGKWLVHPCKQTYELKTERAVPKLGVMLVGWGGNNGTTLTGGILANKQ
jgi:hypothetical protein